MTVMTCRSAVFCFAAGLVGLSACSLVIADDLRGAGADNALVDGGSDAGSDGDASAEAGEAGARFCASVDAAYCEDFEGSTAEDDVFDAGTCGAMTLAAGRGKGASRAALFERRIGGASDCKLVRHEEKLARASYDEVTLRSSFRLGESGVPPLVFVSYLTFGDLSFILVLSTTAPANAQLWMQPSGASADKKVAMLESFDPNDWLDYAVVVRASGTATLTVTRNGKAPTTSVKHDFAALPTPRPPLALTYGIHYNDTQPTSLFVDDVVLEVR